jgi:hypothetical protein
MWHNNTRTSQTSGPKPEGRRGAVVDTRRRPVDGVPLVESIMRISALFITAPVFVDKENVRIES